MFAVPLRDIVRIHSTSGTTGRPVVVGYTKNDLAAWSECTARLMMAAGVTNNDVVQIAFHYDLFTGGFGFHQGAELLGASVIPASSSPLEKQVMIMKDYKTTVLVCTPSTALNLCSTLETLKIHPEALFLKTGLFGAEPWNEHIRAGLADGLHLTAFDNYGLTEIMGPGVAGECTAGKGLHINEDHFIAEIINPGNDQPVQDGEAGELVFTTITKEGFPLIRYRTGDLASLVSRERCACGRTFMRITPISGRTDDIIFFEGMKILPGRIGQILLDIEGSTPHYQIVLCRETNQEVFQINMEISEKITEFDSLKTLENIRASVMEKVEKELGIKVRVALVEPRSLRAAGDRKTRRVIDLRTS